MRRLVISIAMILELLRVFTSTVVSTKIYSYSNHDIFSEFAPKRLG
jgi:hypothetical protein